MLESKTHINREGEEKERGGKRKKSLIGTRCWVTLKKCRYFSEYLDRELFYIGRHKFMDYRRSYL